MRSAEWFGFLRNGINFGSDGAENHKKKHIEPGAIYTEVCGKLPYMHTLSVTLKDDNRQWQQENQNK